MLRISQGSRGSTLVYMGDETAASVKEILLLAAETEVSPST
jgi:hypothetical protein